MESTIVLHNPLNETRAGRDFVVQASIISKEDLASVYGVASAISDPLLCYFNEAGDFDWNDFETIQISIGPEMTG